MPIDPLDTAVTLRAEYEVGRDERVPWDVYGFIERLLAALEAAERKVIEHGQNCVVWITGDPEDAGDVTNVEQAWKAIDEALRFGQERNDEANLLRFGRDEKVARLRAALERIKKMSKMCGAFAAQGHYENIEEVAAAVLTDTEPQP